MASNVYSAMTELQFLNNIFKKNSISSVILNGIDETYFTLYKEQFEFIRDYFNEYNQLPSKETFQAKFTDSWEWVTVTDPEEYLVKKLKEAKLFRDFIPLYKNIGELIKSEKTDEAIEMMASASQQFMKQTTDGAVDLITEAQKRYDSYIERVNNPSNAFVTTGLKELDNILGGWDRQNESAIICARTGIGKSFFTIFFALNAAKAGLRVGYYSGEMEKDLIGYRLDTFEGNIANGSLTHGNANVKEQYKSYIESLPKVVKGNVFCFTPDDLGGTVTVSKLRAVIEKYNLDMLCVDQYSLLDDERHGRTTVDQFANLSKDLRKLQRMKKIPIICACQLNREEFDEGLSTRNIAGSDRIGQDSTTALFIERKGDNVVLTVGKARNAKSGDKLTYAWNINMGVLHYIPTENDAQNGDGIDELEYSYNTDLEKSDSVF